MKIGPAVRPRRVTEEKGKDRTVKKNHKLVIFRLFGEKPPLHRLKPKFAWSTHEIADVITRAKFKDDIFRGYDFTGVEFLIFPIHFAWALQQQRYCAACDRATMKIKGSLLMSVPL